MTRPTLRDVAARAGVSISTVSYALNDASTLPLAEATKEKVRRAARELGYVPNGVARSLQARASRAIGVILGKPLTLPRYAAVVEGIARGLRSDGFRLSLLDETGALRGVDDVRAGNLDGLVFIGHDDQGVPDDLRAGIVEHGVPFVAIDCGPGSGGERYATVDFDYATGVRQVVAHLRTAGVDAILYVRPGIDSPAEDARALALRDEERESGVVVHTLTTSVTVETIARFDAGDADRSHHDDLVDRIAEALADVGSRPEATAIVCAWGVDAEAAYRAASTHDPRVRVAALAAGSLSAQLWPGLTYSRLPLEEGGRVAARLIVAATRGAGGDAGVPERVLLAPALDARH